MTQHWIDIRNADVVMIIGSNAAENHPMAFKWIQEAIKKGATYINVDPRFCRSSSKAHIYARMRSGTDIAFIGGMINYALYESSPGVFPRINQKYVEECTNALFKVRTDFETCEDYDGVYKSDHGTFSGLTLAEGGTPPTVQPNYFFPTNGKYDKTTWNYQYTSPGVPALATSLADPNCVLQKLKKQFQNYTKANVCAITGTNSDVYQQICETFCDTCADDKSATIMYAMGTTQHTVGTQNVRSYAILQLLMGNIGVAGGGINALRGQDNVQGSTDMCILNHILPGYIKCPTEADKLNLDTFINNWAHAGLIIEPDHDYTVNGVEHIDPTSSYWWQHGKKYMVSLIKAWWPTITIDKGYNKLPKRESGKDYSMLSIFEDMSNDQFKGFICDGENPAVSDPDSKHVREALRHLDWMVVIDPYETETAAFWKVDTDGNALTTEEMEDIGTTVYLLPCAVAYEKAGSRSNSGRWAQWHWKGANPPGYTTDLDAIPGGAKDDLEIITLLGKKLKDLYSGGGQHPGALTKLNWPYFNYAPDEDVQTRAEKAAMEVNGYYLNADGSINTAPNPKGLVPKFTLLTDTGTTCSGNWLYCNQFVYGTDSAQGDLDDFEFANKDMFAATIGNRMARRYAADVGNAGWNPYSTPVGYPEIGLHSYWSWCWPLNRRIIYNRASTYQSDGGDSNYGGFNGDAGEPLAPAKYVMYHDGSGWRGDVPDHGAAPGGVYPFIMHKEGHAKLFGPGRAEGPFPWHYEPAESAVTNPMGNYQVNPIIHIYSGAQFGTSSNYPIAATTYRLTEHWHTGSMTRNLPWCNELQPEPFVEMSEEFANSLSIENGEKVKVSCARGSIEVKACVTKRFKPYQLNGQTVHQVGIIWHWGYMTPNPGPSGNVLTPFVGDANTRIQESKAFLVKIEKITT